MPALRLILCLLVLLGVRSAEAGDPSLIDTRLARTLLIDQPQYALGHSQVRFEQARVANWLWRPMTRPTLGRQPEGAWLRFALHNSDTAKRHWYLLLNCGAHRG